MYWLSREQKVFFLPSPRSARAWSLDSLSGRIAPSCLCCLCFFNHFPKGMCSLDWWTYIVLLCFCCVVLWISALEYVACGESVFISCCSVCGKSWCPFIWSRACACVGTCEWVCVCMWVSVFVCLWASMCLHVCMCETVSVFAFEWIWIHFPETGGRREYEDTFSK